MFNFISTNPILLLLSFLLISSVSLTHSNADPRFHHLETSLHHGIVVGEAENNVFSWTVKRSILQSTNGESIGNSSMILAAKRTRRRDPIRNFNLYHGGWNISDKHYFSSVAFSASPLFIIAAIWFIGFGLCLLAIAVHHCCFKRKRFGYSRLAYALSLVFLTLFTICAIVGCIVLYTGQGKFHSSTTHTLNYVVNEADVTVETLRNVSSYLATAKTIGVDQIFLPSNVQNNIDRIDAKINKSSFSLEQATAKNKRDIEKALEAVRLALIITAAVMLFLTILGFLLSIFGMKFLVNILVVIGWILVAGTFILCGVFLVFHNVAEDTCVAMDEWLKHPTEHTALDDILPCVDNATAQETLFQSKDVSYQLISLVNLFITNVSNSNLPLGPIYYNQSGPFVPNVCNPFNPDKSDRVCAPGELALTDAPQEWKKHVCQTSVTNKCTTIGRLTPSFYAQITVAINVSYGLYHYGPFLVDLQDCTFVRDTFTLIQKDHCPGLKLYSKWIYIGLAMVSTAVMLSLVFWVLYARERQHRVYTKEFNEAPKQDRL